MTAPPHHPDAAVPATPPTADPRTGSQSDAVTISPKPNYEPGSTRITRGEGVVVQGFGSLVGATWGDFKLGDLLGRGGMGAVYRAHQLSLDRAVAIKILPPELAEIQNLRERFLREARAIALVASPHIVQVFHAGTHTGWHYYAMELIDGPDLGRRLRDGWRPGVAEARDLVLQAARGLATAARHNIVHRDIKPANMLLTPDGCLKLTDFGLVRRAGEDQLTAHGQIMGTAGYLSPEQALGQPCDARSDLYALGVVLYELLTGKLPFTADDAAGVIYQHVHEPPAPVESRCPDVDPATAAICTTLLAKSPDDRYQSAADLVTDLEAAAAGRRLHHTVVRRRPRRWSRIALGILAVLAVGATIGTWVLRRNSDQQAAATMSEADRVAQAVRAEAERLAAARTTAAAAAEAKHHDAYGRFTDISVAGASFRLREIPPGSGRLGSPADEEGRSRDETPGTATFTTTWWIGDSEVTQAQWKAVMGPPPDQLFPGPELPVASISRPQADSFCARLAVLVPGVQARLPTEAEWERVAHAGSDGPWAGGRALATQAWYAANAGKRPHPVRQFPPNPWGLYDIHGNVAEWTADAYTPRNGAGQELIDPAPLPGIDKVVIKGGAWDDDPEDCRIARRDSARSGSKRLGFRILVTKLPRELR